MSKLKEIFAPEKQKCPNCNSYKTLRYRDYVGNVSILFAGCGSCIFAIVFFPLAPFIFLAGIISAIVAFAIDKNKYKCNNCKYAWTI